MDIAHGESSVDGQQDRTGAVTDTSSQMTLTMPNNIDEESKRAQTERAGSQTSNGVGLVSKANNSNNFCPTYQVLERTNIQEKQILNV